MATVTNQLTITAGAYSSGQCIGGKQTCVNPFYGTTESNILNSIVISDLASQGLAIDIVLFDSDPSATTFTDNSALDIADADLSKIISIAQVTNYSAFADNSVGFTSSIGWPLTSKTSFFYTLVARGSATFASTSDLAVRLLFV